MSNYGWTVRSHCAERRANLGGEAKKFVSISLEVQENGSVVAEEAQH